MRALTMPGFQLLPVKKHPGYTRSYAIYFFSFWLPAVAVYSLAIFFDVSEDHYLHDPVIALFLILGVLWFIVTTFYPSEKCPECKNKTQPSTYIQNRNRHIICDNCGVEWDLGVKEPTDN
jgi:hypothetical protein